MRKPFQYMITGIFLSLQLIGAAVAENETQPLTLDQAIETAIANNPGLKASQAKLGVSEAAIITAGARLNPVLMSDNGIAEKTYRLGVSKTFEMGGKPNKRVAVAKVQKDILIQDMNTALLDLRSQVRQAYTELYTSMQRQKMFHDLLDRNETLLQIAQNREKTGDISALDVLQAEIVVVNTKNDLETSEYQVIKARNTLNTLMNLPIATLMNLAAPNTLPKGICELLPPVSNPASAPPTEHFAAFDVDPGKLIEQALKLRPEFKQNQLLLELNQRHMDLIKSNLVPNVTLSAGPDLLTGPGSQINAFIMGNVELPVLNRQEGPIKETLARTQQLKNEGVALQNKIRLEVANAYISFALNNNRVKRYEQELLPKSQEIVTKSQRSFSLGKSSVLQAIAAEQAFTNIRISYLDALMQYQNAISELERTVGILL